MKVPGTCVNTTPLVVFVVILFRTSWAGRTRITLRVLVDYLVRETHDEIPRTAFVTFINFPIDLLDERTDVVGWASWASGAGCTLRPCASFETLVTLWTS